MVSTTQNYELYFILNPELTAEQVDKQVEKISKSLKSDLKAENIEVDKQGLKKLAYSIQKQQTGFYVLITFDLALGSGTKIAAVEKKLNMEKDVLRYIIVNQTEYLTQKEKESLSNAEITTHNELNKKARKPRDRKCIARHLGVRVVDYKDTDFLNQFTSPYAKIFHRDKTGTSAKYQRKITRAIKRARHMALMPFTPQD
jgi:small subunit ribosomal protein S18